MKSIPASSNPSTIPQHPNGSAEFIPPRKKETNEASKAVPITRIAFESLDVLITANGWQKQALMLQLLIGKTRVEGFGASGGKT